MQSTWQFKTSPPGQKVQLSITASHPEFGDYFLAVLTGEKVENVTNPLLFFWLMPHKVAFGIYWQVCMSPFLAGNKIEFVFCFWA